MEEKATPRPGNQPYAAPTQHDAQKEAFQIQARANRDNPSAEFAYDSSQDERSSSCSTCSTCSSTSEDEDESEDAPVAGDAADVAKHLLQITKDADDLSVNRSAEEPITQRVKRNSKSPPIKPRRRRKRTRQQAENPNGDEADVEWSEASSSEVDDAGEIPTNNPSLSALTQTTNVHSDSRIDSTKQERVEKAESNAPVETKMDRDEEAYSPPPPSSEQIAAVNGHQEQSPQPDEEEYQPSDVAAPSSAGNVAATTEQANEDSTSQTMEPSYHPIERQDTTHGTTLDSANQDMGEEMDEVLSDLEGEQKEIRSDSEAEAQPGIRIARGQGARPSDEPRFPDDFLRALPPMRNRNELDIQKVGFVHLIGDIFDLNRGLMILVKAIRNPNAPVLDSGSVLCTNNKDLIGVVAEPIGTVTDPIYLIALRSREELEARDLQVGQIVWCFTEHTVYALMKDARSIKATDASNAADQELDETNDYLNQDFSDDEKERYAKSKGKKGHKDGIVGIVKDDLAKFNSMRANGTSASYGYENQDHRQKRPRRDWDAPPPRPVGLPTGPPAFGTAVPSRGFSDHGRGHPGGQSRFPAPPPWRPGPPGDEGFYTRLNRPDDYKGPVDEARVGRGEAPEPVPLYRVYPGATYAVPTQTAAAQWAALQQSLPSAQQQWGMQQPAASFSGAQAQGGAGSPWGFPLPGVQQGMGASTYGSYDPVFGSALQNWMAGAWGGGRGRGRGRGGAGRGGRGRGRGGM